MKFGYQKEIDSLRVFAIIPVILFHLNYNFSPNGYLGVDLFFVISGFVITKTLLKYKEIHGEIEIISFFLRRLKRIYPALIVMIVISSIFVSYFGVINFFNFHLYLKTGLFSIFGVSNIFLIYKSDDYFLNQENNPFTHTWSLGVEEQFYFIYPFLLFLIFKINTNKSFNKLIYYILTIISAVSLYLFFFNNSILSNFYSPIIRFWELSLGCLAFFLYNENKNKISDLFVFIYIPVLLFIYFFDLSFLSYQIKTFITVFLTFLFLLRKKSENFVINHFLENKIIIYVGKISYSLYLWHLPIIYLSSIYFYGLNYFVFTILIIWICAHLSYNFIEIPFRSSKKYDLVITRLIQTIPILATLGVLIILIFNFDVLKNKANEFVNIIYFKTNKLNYVKNNSNLGSRLTPNYFLDGRDVSKNCFFDKNKFNKMNYSFNTNCFKLKNKKKLFIINGDCHSQHFIPMLDNSKLIENVLFVGDISLSLLSEECLKSNTCNRDEVLRKNYHDKTISKINELSEEYEEIVLINKIFLTEKNKNKILNNYEDVFNVFVEKFNDNIKILFIEPTPVFNFGPEGCVLSNNNCSISLTDSVFFQNKISEIYHSISNSRDNVYLFSINQILCPNKECFLYDKNNDLLYYKDVDNISVEFSKSLSTFFDKWLIKNKIE